MTKYNKVHHDTFIPPVSPLENLSITGLNENFLQFSEFNRESKFKCAKKCSKPDCLMQDFKIILEREKKTEFRNEISLLATKILKLKVVYKAQISLVDFITYILSCISFWLGFSPLPFLLSLKFLKKKQIITAQTNRRQDLVLNTPIVQVGHVTLASISASLKNNQLRTANLELQLIAQNENHRKMVYELKNQIRHLELRLHD